MKNAKNNTQNNPHEYDAQNNPKKQNKPQTGAQNCKKDHDQQ